MAIPVTFIGDKYAKQQKQKTTPRVNGGNPRLVSQAEFKLMQPLNTSTRVIIPNMFWRSTPIAAGVLFLTSQGQRFVLEANSSRVLYILQNPASTGNNKIYAQMTKGFMADVVYYPVEEAGRQLQTVKKIAEYEMQFIIGIFSVTSWGAFAAVLGMDVLEFAVKNQARFPKWARIIKAAMQTRQDLKKYAPTLYDKLLYSTLLIAWEGTKFAGSKPGEVSEALADSAIHDPKIAGRGGGIIAGKLGIKVMNGRISILSAIWTILFTTASKALSAVPGAVQTATAAFKDKQFHDKVQVADKIFEIIKGANVQVSKEETMVIVGEIYDHPRELVDSLSNLAKAFKDAN